jgi:hypothetical protein
LGIGTKTSEPGERYGDDEYVSEEWLFSCLGKSCQNCSDCLTAAVENGKVECNLTAQRLNNDLPHYLENVVPFCVVCNCSLSSRVA